MSARIVFDLDGTLIDSASDIRAMANAALDAVGATPLSMAETRSFIGHGIGVFVERMRNARGLPDSTHERLLVDMTARYDTAVDLTEAYPNVVPTLVNMSGIHRLGICTNKLHRPCVAVLRHLGIDHFFQTIWGGDSLLARKPDPAPLLAAFDALGDGPRIYVGDSEIDAETAVRAEVPFLLYTPGYRHSAVKDIPHHATFDDYSALPALIENYLSTT